MPYRLLWDRYSRSSIGNWVEYKSSALGEHDVRISVKAAGVNYADVLMVQGQYPDAPRPPGTPGYEVSGIISEVGSSVKGIKVGDKVVSLTRFGGYSTEVVVHYLWVCKIPDSISMEAAAGMPVAGLTATVALNEMARVKKEDTVLVHSASGGVGLVAIQLCNLVGARVVGIVSSETKRSYLLKKYPKMVVIIDSNYRQYPKYLKQEKIPITISLNSVAGHTIDEDVEILEPFGRLVAFGIASATGKGFIGMVGTIVPLIFNNPLKTMNRNIGIFGLNLLKLFGEGYYELIHHSLFTLMSHMQSQKIVSNISEKIPMKDAAEAHKMLLERKTVGKLVLITE